MKKIVGLSLSLIIVVSTSCKKSGVAGRASGTITTTSEEKTYPSYSNLKVGNYWIYKYYQEQPNGIFVLSPGQDSSYVEKDTLIGGNRYSKYVYFDQSRNKKVVEFLRDSLHYIVSPNGIRFSSEDTTRIFFDTLYVVSSHVSTSDTVARVVSRMRDMNVSTEVPAGTFATCNARTDFYMYPKFSSPELRNPKFVHKKYAMNIGLIVETNGYWASSNYTIERRLVRYHVNN